MTKDLLGHRSQKELSESASSAHTDNDRVDVWQIAQYSPLLPRAFARSCSSLRIDPRQPEGNTYENGDS
jgi:hypothetical protein